MALGSAGVWLGLGTLALVSYQQAGLAGLVGLTVITLGAAGGVFWWLRRQIGRQPLPFADTLAELKKDREWVSRLG